MEFVCRLGTAEGQIVDEVRQASSAAALRSELEGSGYHVFRIRRRGISGLSLPGFGERRRRRQVPARTLLIFNQELAALLRSGLPVLQALQMMMERQREPFFRELLRDVHDRVKSGSDLSDAFSAYADVLPALYPPTLQAGERSGELEQVLRRFVKYQQMITEARKKVVSALVYPAVLIGLSIGLIAVMTIYVVPRFTEFFSALETDLPLITRVTLGVSGFVQQNWLWGLIIAVVGGLLFSQWKRSEAGHLAVDRLKLRLPLVGVITSHLANIEFCRSLSTLLAGGIPAVIALESAVRAVGNVFVRRRLAPLVVRVKEGQPLYAALEESGVSPEITVDMVKVGEATGALAEMLNNAAEFMDEEVETRLQRILTLLEPVMLVLMGTIVATLLVSVYLPLFSLLGEVRS